MSCGSGASLGVYALKGLCDFGICSNTEAFVWAEIAEAEQMTKHPSNCVIRCGLRFSFIA